MMPGFIAPRPWPGLEFPSAFFEEFFRLFFAELLDDLVPYRGMTNLSLKTLGQCFVDIRQSVMGRFSRTLALSAFLSVHDYAVR